MTDQTMTLTGNDLALAAMGAGLALAWHRAQSRTRFQRQEIAKLKALIAKLDAISAHAYPYENRGEDRTPIDFGDEPIMKTDGAVVRRTRRAAQKFNDEG